MKIFVSALMCAHVTAFNRKPSNSISRFQPDSAQSFGLTYLEDEAFSAPPALHKNIPFKKIKGNPLTLDIHMPNGEKPNKSLPALIYLHPGSWLIGSKEQIHRNARRVLDEGYALVSIDYRLVSQPGKWGGASVTWPAQGDDAADAVRWLKQHGSKFGIDPKRLGCWGDSAGGQLCAWMASAGATSSSTKLNVAVVMFGRSCMLCQKDCPVDWYFGFDKSTLKHLVENKDNLTAEEMKQVELVKSADATQWVSSSSKGKTTPTFIGHGQKDDVVPYDDARHFAKALSEAGVSYKLEIVPNGGHEYQGWPDTVIDKAIAFANKYM